MFLFYTIGFITVFFLLFAVLYIYYKTSSKKYIFLTTGLGVILVCFGILLFSYNDTHYQIELEYNDETVIVIDLEYTRDYFDGKKMIITPKDNYTLEELIQEISNETTSVYSIYTNYGYVYLDDVSVYIEEGENNEFTLSLSYHSISISNNNFIAINFPINIIESVAIDNTQIQTSSSMTDLTEYYSNFDNVTILENTINIDISYNDTVVSITITYSSEGVDFSVIE